VFPASDVRAASTGAVGRHGGFTVNSWLFAVLILALVLARAGYL
jgi:hypothetical protein